MAKLVDVIEVRMWGRRVGALALDKNSGFYAFEYDAGFLKTGIDLAPMALPIAKAAGPTTFTDLPTQTYKRLPAFIADSLPDDFGNALIDSYLATHGIAKGLITPLDRLAYMGRRAMGALEFKPVSGPDRGKFVAIEMKSLVESAKRVLSGEVNIDREGEASLANLFQVGTSAGGARAKAVIALKESTGEIRPGQFNVAEGYVHWLLKFDGVGADNELGSTSNYGRIEYAYHLMAKEAGINMEPCRLLEENGRAHFMTRRFDRGGQRPAPHTNVVRGESPGLQATRNARLQPISHGDQGARPGRASADRGIPAHGIQCSCLQLWRSHKKLLVFTAARRRLGARPRLRRDPRLQPKWRVDVSALNEREWKIYRDPARRPDGGRRALQSSLRIQGTEICFGSGRPVAALRPGRRRACRGGERDTRRHYGGSRNVSWAAAQVTPSSPRRRCDAPRN